MPSELVKDTQEGFVELEGRDIDLSELENAYDQDLNDMTANQSVDQTMAPGA